MPDKSQITAGRAHDAFVENAAVELSRHYPDRVSRRTRRELLALIERSRERARGYGLETSEHILKFLHCVMLLDNDLAKPTNSDVAYVLDTLTVPNKPAERRIERALSIARKVAAAGPVSGSGSGSRSGSGSSARLSGLAPTTAAPLQAAPPIQPPAPLQAAPPIQPAAPPRQTPANDVTIDPETFDVGSPAARGKAAPHLHAAPDPKGRVERSSATASALQMTKADPPPAIENWSQTDAESCPNIEGFRIVEKIAAGGMGTVFRAHDLQLDIEVAIKVVRSLHPWAQQQFLLEARAAARLQHPNIIPVLRFDRFGQGGYCVMQLIKGQDAQKLVKLFGENAAHELRADGLLDLVEIDRATMHPDLRGILRTAKPYYRLVAYWLAGVAEGLDRAHSEGIIHFDIKPSNIILSSDGRMMLGDFGLATLVGQQHASGTCIGTPRYLSPEMLAIWASRGGANETDARVDIWGLGCVLYEMLAYRHVYDGTLAGVLRSIATADPVPPRDAAWATPPELEAICLKALSRNPEHRYARALEMADALREYVAGKPSGPDAGKSKWRWGKKNTK